MGISEFRSFFQENALNLGIRFLGILAEALFETNTLSTVTAFVKENMVFKDIHIDLIFYMGVLITHMR
jgi:hypothetical protein